MWWRINNLFGSANHGANMSYQKNVHEKKKAAAYWGEFFDNQF